MDHPELWQMEEQFWLAGASFYAENLDDQALMAFPEPVGVLDRAATIAALANAPRWTSVSFHGQRSIEPHSATVVLSYTAEADRGTAESAYRALAVSVYTKSASGWKLAFHQQVPLPTEAGKS